VVFGSSNARTSAEVQLPRDRKLGRRRKKGRTPKNLEINKEEENKIQWASCAWEFGEKRRKNPKVTTSDESLEPKQPWWPSVVSQTLSLASLWIRKKQAPTSAFKAFTAC
jgi:hypothetical protein